MNRKEIYKLKALNTAVKVTSQMEYNLIVEKFKEYTGVYKLYKDGLYNANYPYINIILDEGINNYIDRFICGTIDGTLKNYIYHSVEDFLENFEDKQEAVSVPKNNKKLDIEFIEQRDGLTIVMEVKHVDESLIRKSKDDDIKLLSKSNNGAYAIWSNCYPAIGKNQITVFGINKLKNNEFCSYTFRTTNERNGFLYEINKLIDKINEEELVIDINKNSKYELGNNFSLNVNGSNNRRCVYIRKKEESIDIKTSRVSSDIRYGEPFEDVKIQIEEFTKKLGFKVKLIRGE